MRWHDRPLPRLGRSPRELLVIGVAVASAVRFARSDPGGAVMFAIAAVAFGARFFAARVIATGIAIAAVAVHVSAAVTPRVPLRPELLGIAYFLTAILVLGAPALVAAFDDAPSRGRFLRNFWRDLPRPDRRSLARVAYGVGTTGAMAYYHHHGIVVAIAAACGVLLVAGRAVAALVATLGAAVLLALAWHQVPLAIAAGFTAVSAAPWAWRLLRHA